MAVERTSTQLHQIIAQSEILVQIINAHAATLPQRLDDALPDPPSKWYVDNCVALVMKLTLGLYLISAYIGAIVVGAQNHDDASESLATALIVVGTLELIRGCCIEVAISRAIRKRESKAEMVLAIVGFCVSCTLNVWLTVAFPSF